MKKYITMIVGMVMTFCFYGCSDENIEIDHSYDNISAIQEYRLPENLESGEVLANSGLDIDNEEIVLIANDSEFKNAFRNYSNNYGEVLPIDFRSNKLLLVQGNCSKIGHINKSLSQISDKKYQLTIEVTLTPFSPAVTYAWVAGYVIPNNMEIENISLSIDYKR